jgi:hypothetical protein
MANMRIVGMNAVSMFIQKEVKGEWVQEVLSNCAFEEMMQKEYTPYWEEYIRSGKTKSAESYFYHYGEDEDMKYRGEAYIYGKTE